MENRIFTVGTLSSIRKFKFFTKSLDSRDEVSDRFQTTCNRLRSKNLGQKNFYLQKNFRKKTDIVKTFCFGLSDQIYSQKNFRPTLRLFAIFRQITKSFVKIPHKNLLSIYFYMLIYSMFISLCFLFKYLNSINSN